MTTTVHTSAKRLIAAVLCSAALVLISTGSLRAADAPPHKPIQIEKPERTMPVDFEKEILPVLNTNCLACHNKSKPKNGLVLETPADIKKGGENGPAVVPGKPAESLMLKAAAHEVDEVMPPKGNKVNAANLTPQQLGLIQLWIEQGAAGEVKGAGPVAWQPVPATLAPIYAVAVSPDGEFAACGRGNRIYVYQLPSGKLAAQLTDPSATAPAAAASAKSSASAESDNAAGGVAHRDLVTSLAFSPDSKHLASGSYREVKLWRRPSGNDSGSDSSKWAIERTLGGDASGSDAKPSPLADRVNALAFSPDDGGKRLATGGGVPSRGGEIRIWNVEEGKVEKSFDDVHSDTVLGLAFSPDGKRLASASADKWVRIVDLGNGKILKGFEGHTHHALGVAWRRGDGGKTLASVGADNTLRFWDAESGERKKVVQGFDKEVTSVCFVGDTDQVLITSGDGKVKTVKESGSDGRSYAGASDFMFACAASADGKTVIAGGQDGVLRAWNGADGKAGPTFGKE